MESGPDVSRLLVVGRFQGLFGICGGLKVHSYTRPKINIGSYSPWIVSCAGSWLELVPRRVRTHGKTLIAEIDGYSDRDLAAVLLGLEISISRQQLPDPEPDSYYWADLIGFEVANTEGIVLGSVVNIMETGSADVLVVRNEIKEHLIPFVRDVYIYKVDFERRCIVVDWQLDY